MKITIQPEVFQKLHPEFKVVFILAKGIDNKSKAKEADHLLKEVKKAVLLTFNKDTFKSHYLVAPWTVAREEFGKKAKHYHTSVEQLLKKVLCRQNIEAKDTLTVLLRYLALKHIVPVGADDPAKVTGEMIFSVATGKERAAELRKLKTGELYYRDARKILGAKLDYWKNSQTALKPMSKSALIHFEFLPPISPAKQKEIVQEATELVQMFCGGKVKAVVLDKRKRSTLL